MALSPFALREDYWTTFELTNEDIEFLYNYLLEKETPQTSYDLVSALVDERIRREKAAIEKQRTSQGQIYRPKERYAADDQVIFPALSWKVGKVIGVRQGRNPALGEFDVIKVQFTNDEQREFAAGLEDHPLNDPLELSVEDESLDANKVLASYDDVLVERVEEDLSTNPDFVRIAGKWFPRTLLVDINAGHLNLAEAVLDMSGGGPLPTSELLKQIDLSANGNDKLLEFSLDLALQEDPRFDEVGPEGEVLWFLNRLEPEEVTQPPVWLRYQEIEYDRSLLTPEMTALERDLDDELSQLANRRNTEEAEVRLIYPHWRAGTLPLSARIRHLFPTAYESPRIRFTLIDGDTGEQFPGWVVRHHKYVYGLRDWYTGKSLIPGSLVWVRRGKNPGEVIVRTENRRPSREWIRTVLVGSDGGIVFAMLKQIVSSGYDERMTVAVPDVNALDQAWTKAQKDRIPFERIVVNTVRELAKLNPQSHVHASELYAAINLIRRCPPGPILALLASRSWFVHVGDQHYRFDDSERG